jgi:hypothetical protein
MKGGSLSTLFYFEASNLIWTLFYFEALRACRFCQQPCFPGL